MFVHFTTSHKANAITANWWGKWENWCGHTLALIVGDPEGRIRCCTRGGPKGGGENKVKTINFY